MSVSVVTAALPERLGVTLPRALESVARQTVKPNEHLVGVDYERRGGGLVRAQLVEAARSEWVAILDDDDELLPHHLETLLEAATTPGPSVVYSDWSGHVAAGLPADFDREAIEVRNMVPATVLVRRSSVLEVGNYEDVYAADWHLWIKLARAGASFRRVPVVTYVYHREHSLPAPPEAREEVLRALR